VRLQVFQCDDGTFLHHITEVSGEREFAFALGDAGLDEEDVTTVGVHARPRDHTGHIVALVLVARMARAVDLHQIIDR
jgi:hypothetical protein